MRKNFYFIAILFALCSCLKTIHEPNEPKSSMSSHTAKHWLTLCFIDPQTGNPLLESHAVLEEIDDRGVPYEGSTQKIKRPDSQGKLFFRGIQGKRVQIRGGSKDFADMEPLSLDVDREVRIPLGRTKKLDRLDHYKKSQKLVIMGRVVDKETNEPIQAFYIDKTAHYNAEGRFVLGYNDASKQNSLLIGAPLYQTEGLHHLVPQPPDQAQDHLFYLAKAQTKTIKIQVLDASTSRPLSNADLYFCHQDYYPMDMNPVLSQNDQGQNIDGNFTHSRKARLDDNGCAILTEDKEWPLYFCVMAQGHERLIIQPYKRFMYQDGDYYRIPLRPEAVISGKYMRHGSLCTEVSVDLAIIEEDPRFHQNVENKVAITRTDKEGKFYFGALSPGFYVLKSGEAMSREDYVPYSQSFQLSADEKHTVDLTDKEEINKQVIEKGDDKTYTLTGRLLYAGKPVRHDAFVFMPLEGEGDHKDNPGGMIYTDDEGKFRLGGLLPGKYRIEWGEEGQNNINRIITVNANQEMDITPGGNLLTGRIKIDTSETSKTGVRLKTVILAKVDADGKAKLRKTAMELLEERSYDEADLERPTEQLGCTLIGDRLVYEGKFKGQYRIGFVYEAGIYQWLSETTQTLELDNLQKSQDFGLIEIKSPHPVTFTGTLLDEQGKPVPNIKITLYPTNLDGGAVPYTVSDDKGRFCFVNLFPGECTVNFKKQGMDQDAPEKLEITGNIEKNLVLPLFKP